MSAFWYLGPSGALVAIPSPGLGLLASPELVGKVSVSLNGTKTLYRASQPRTWKLQWPVLTEDQSNYLRLVGHGLVGSPLRFIDGEMRNRLPVRVASGGSYTQSAVDFQSFNSSTPTWIPISDPPTTVPVRGCIAWVRLTTSLAWLTTVNAEDRVPLLPTGEDVRISFWARGTAIQAEAGIDWWDSAGTNIAHTTGTPVTLNPFTWTYLDVVGTPIATEIEVSPTVDVQSGQPASVIEATGFQIAPASAPTTWTIGGGAPTVIAGSELIDFYVLDDQRQFALTLLERRM